LGGLNTPSVSQHLGTLEVDLLDRVVREASASRAHDLMGSAANAPQRE
jgi:hypothetical protein